jgi:hypothetical protein
VVHIFSKDPTDRDEVVRNAQLKALACCQSSFGRQRRSSLLGLISEKRVPRRERSAENLESQLDSQVRYGIFVRTVLSQSQSSSPGQFDKAYLGFPSPSSPKSVDSIEPCAEQHRSVSEDTDGVQHGNSWSQYYHSMKAHRVLGC